MLLNHGEKKFTIEFAMFFSGMLHWSALHRAVWNLDKSSDGTKIVEMLMKAGANVLALTDTRETPYMLAKRRRKEAS